MEKSKEIGSRIAALRRAKDMTQEQLIERIGDDILSLSTLKRIETGRGHLSLRNIAVICAALNCRIQDLIDDVDIRSAMKEFIIDCGDEVSEEDEGNIDFNINILNLCYPKEPEDELFDHFAITNLMQFIIYLPLMDPVKLTECLMRIDGVAFQNEYYVLSKIDYLYRNIPDCTAKRYADLLAKRCNADNFIEYHTSEMTQEEAAVSANYTTDQLWEMGKEYSKILKAYRDAFLSFYILAQGR